MREISELLGAGLTRTWEIGEVLLETKTEYQELLIARTAQGISLFCDGERQSTEASQLVYHEALMVPPLLLAERLRRVLIIGSSEGVASQLAIAMGADEVDHVDIDREAVAACAEHLPYGYTPEELRAAEVAESGVRVHYLDGWQWVADAAARGRSYDVVVVDLPDENDDPAAQHNRLYGSDFLAACARLLSPGGVVSVQAGCPTLWRNETLAAAWQRFTGAFPSVVYYGSDEHEWAFLSARTDTVDSPLETMLARLADAPAQPSTIDADALRGGTVPPRSLRA